MDIGPGELLIALAVLLVVFGSSRLPGLGRSMGQAMGEIRQWGRVEERSDA